MILEYCQAIQGEGTIEELVVTYTYNQQGQVATITDELNRVTKYSYYDGGSEQGLLQNRIPRWNN